VNKTASQGNLAIKASRLDVFVCQLSSRLPAEIGHSSIILVDSNGISYFTQPKCRNCLLGVDVHLKSDQVLLIIHQAIRRTITNNQIHLYIFIYLIYIMNLLLPLRD
jgi:hypothetical protein